MRSPIVTRNVLSATVGWSRTRRTASARSMPSAENGRSCGPQAPHVARHARRLAEEGRQVHVHRLVAEERVAHLEAVVVGGDADDRERAALALAQRAEEVEARGRDREDVALLRLVRPDLARGHPRLLVGRRAQVDPRAARGAVGELGQRVREAARPHVVDGEDRVRRRPARSSGRSPPAPGAGSRRCRAGRSRSRGRRCWRRWTWRRPTRRPCR